MYTIRWVDLRNLDILAPLYAALSDAVVYCFTPGCEHCRDGENATSRPHIRTTQVYTEGKARDEAEYRNRSLSVNTVDFARTEKEGISRKLSVITVADPQTYSDAKRELDPLSGLASATR